MKPTNPRIGSAGVLRAAPSGGLGRHSDLVLVLLCVIVVALMVLPIAPALLDLLIAVNLACAIALLLYSLYVSSPVALSTFPSLLLITTLLRIAINVASTRQILMHGRAGEIIATFGKLVMGGSIAIGLVVFAIITVVQFIVIAKGAERVAEVIARFTLDAIPGKQMSIDSDLRAGLISEDEARSRRRDVDRESRFYGAMDGAMKFVKGDAIAGIVIILVNLIGGLAIGILVHELDAGTAAHRYSVLSVGEGLSAQIPALFIALAAAIIVTRSSSSEGEPLSRSVLQQITAQPRALMLSGAVVCLFALVPGFPRLTFGLLGLAVIAIGLLLGRQARLRVDADAPGLLSMARDGAVDPPPLLDSSLRPAFANLLIELPPTLLQELSREDLDLALQRMRSDLHHGLGLPFPGLRIRVNRRLQPRQYALRLLEVPSAEGEVLPGHVLAFTHEGSAPGAASDGPATFVGPGTAWVPRSRRREAEQRGLACWSITELIVYHLEAISQLYPHRLLGLQETQSLMQACAKDYPDLSREALKVLPLPRLMQLLQALVQEGVSLRHLRDILHVAVAHGGSEKNDETLIARMRTALAPALTAQHRQADGRISAFVLDPQCEEQLRRSISLSANGPVAELPAEQLRTLIERIQDAVLGLPAALARDRVPLLAAADVRRVLRRLIEHELPWLPVLSYDELLPGSSVDTLCVLRTDGSL